MLAWWAATGGQSRGPLNVLVAPPGVHTIKQENILGSIMYLSLWVFDKASAGSAAMCGQWDH